MMAKYKVSLQINWTPPGQDEEKQWDPGEYTRTQLKPLGDEQIEKLVARGVIEAPEE
jgi:hypothetical protein